MEIECTWSNKMSFTAKSAQHEVSMDVVSPLGDDSALSPKQLLLASVCGCTAMDVIALMKKHKQPVSAFKVDAKADLAVGAHPMVFKEIQLQFRLEGELDPAVILESVLLSQTRYCGVSAMVSKGVPITYTVWLNSENIGAGKADFN